MIQGRVLRSVDAFQDHSSLTSIVLPESLTRIADHNFWGCSGLESVTFPNGLTTIGAYAFRDCQALTNVSLPAGITSIGESAFYYCTNLLTYKLLTDGGISVGRNAFRLSRSLPPGGTVFVLPEHLASFGGINAKWHGLNVALTDTPASPYSHAVYDAGLSGLDRLPDAMPFRDGVSNLLKLAFNMDLSGFDNGELVPGAESGLPSFRLVLSGDEFVWRVEYLRRRDSMIHYSVVKSTSLRPDDFHPMSGSEEVSQVFIDDETGVEWERVVIEESVDLAATPRLFGRVEVGLP